MPFNFDGIDFGGMPGYGMMTPGMGQKQGQGILTPEVLGLLGAAAGFAKASGPSRLPTSFGQVLGEGLTGGLQGYQQGRQIEQQQLTDTAKRNFVTQFPQYASLYALDPKTAVERAYPKPGESFGKVDPKDYTPESVAAFARSGNHAELVPVRKKDAVNLGGSTTFVDPYNPPPQPLAHTMTPDAVANLNFRKYEFNNLSANQREQLKNELARLNISERQLNEGQVQLMQDNDGNVFAVNKITRTGSPVGAEGGGALHIQKPMTESQANANIYGNRAAAADKIMRGLEEKVSTTGIGLKRGIENLPLIGGPAGVIANAALSSNQQQVEQAQRDFVNAVLRKESGATISPSEFQSAIRQYFPQPGDSKAVIDQKRANREIVISGLRAAAGRSPAEGASPVVTNPQANVPFPAAQAKTINWADLK